MKHNRKLFVLVLLVILLATAVGVAACAPAPTPAPTAAPPTAAPAATNAPAPTAVPPTAVPPTAAPTAVPLPAVINLGAVVSQSGPFGAGGLQIKNGYELGVEAVNKAGGVDFGTGKVQLKLTILDDESDPTKMVQRMETLNSDNKVSVYLGGFGSPLNVAASAVAEKNKTPYLGVAFAFYGVHQQGFKYLFSPFVKDPGITASFFQMVDTLNPKPTKFALFSEKTDGGAEVQSLSKAEVTKRSATLVADETYAPGTTDYTAMITKARDGNAEVVVSFPTGPDGIAMVKQMKELGFNPKLILFIRAADAPTWSQSLGKDADYVVLAPGWHPAVKFPGAAEMNAAHQAKYNSPALATTGPAYAIIQIVANALSRAKSDNRDKIRDAIATTDMMTVEGPVKFNPDGTAPMIVIFDQWQAGKQELVWPTDQQTKPLAYPAPAFAGR
jgi:branched-chain amino acid transport system substrate-binding protein